jgi:hypothetical protein
VSVTSILPVSIICMQFIKPTFLVICCRIIPLYRDDFRQSSIVKHDKKIVLLSITISLIIPGVIFEGPTLLHTGFNKLIIMSVLN